LVVQNYSKKEVKKNIDINIDSLSIEGVDIRNSHLLQVEIEQELTQMINQNGYPNGDYSIETNTLSGTTLIFSSAINAANVAQSIASSIYSGMRNSGDGSHRTNG
jgi:hypothetical protein